MTSHLALTIAALYAVSAVAFNRLLHTPVAFTGRARVAAVFLSLAWPLAFVAAFLMACVIAVLGISALQRTRTPPNHDATRAAVKLRAERR
jgi:membrane protein implicated in regulation of membrane protease activity